MKTFFILIIGFVAASNFSIDRAESKIMDCLREEIQPINQWGGKTRDETHRDAGPENGMITDVESMTELWGKWMPEAAVPEIDFAKDMVLVSTTSGPNQMRLGRLTLEDGNVNVLAMATRMGGPGFGFILVQVPREGIKSVNGVPVPAMDDAAGEAAMGEAPADSISVTIIGTLQTGIMAIGGESTGTVIRSGNVTWELKLTREQAQSVEALNGKKVKVAGQLNKVAGIEIRERWIVSVEAIAGVEAAGGE